MVVGATCTFPPQGSTSFDEVPLGLSILGGGKSAGECWGRASSADIVGAEYQNWLPQASSQLGRRRKQKKHHQLFSWRKLLQTILKSFNKSPFKQLFQCWVSDHLTQYAHPPSRDSVSHSPSDLALSPDLQSQILWMFIWYRSPGLCELGVGVYPLPHSIALFLPTYGLEKFWIPIDCGSALYCS